MQRTLVHIESPPAEPATSTAALDDPLSLASALAARLCHDVAGLLGTLAGTLELIGEAPEAVELAADTAAILSARLRLLRAAWGGGGGALDGAGILELACGLPGIERLRIDATSLRGSLEEDPARLALCLLLAAAPTLPRGTLVSLLGAADGGFTITLEGPGATWPASLAAAGPSHARSALAASFAQLLASRTGWHLTASAGSVTAGRL
jgi:histidine phosphotransferase ChpT